MTATGLATMAGALTPTEVLRAYRLGSDVVKVFPGSLTGPFARRLGRHRRRASLEHGPGEDREPAEVRSSSTTVVGERPTSPRERQQSPTQRIGQGARDTHHRRPPMSDRQGRHQMIEGVVQT